MSSSYRYCPLFLILLLSQLHQGFTACPQGQYSVTVNSQSTCVDQAVVTARLRPMTVSLVYMLVFEDGKSPFTDITDLQANMVVTLSSSVETFSNPQTYLVQAITDDLSVVQVILTSATEIPYDTVMTITFTDFSTDETRPSVIKSSVVFPLTTMKDLTDTNVKLIDVITDIDYILEIVWIVVSILNPYWILYMDTKLYRETLNLFKYVNVQHEPFLTSFYAVNDKKVSGLRFPNLFGIFVLGNNYASEWSKYPKYNLAYDYINSDRTEDIKVLADTHVLQFNEFPLFLDNFGTELCFILACLIIALGLELTFRLSKAQNSLGPLAKAVRIARHIMWNFLLMNVLGSCQSLIFYAGLQFQAFVSEKTTNNIVSFAVAIVALLVAVASVCAYVIWASRKRVRTNSISINSDKRLEFFTTVLDFYKTAKLYQPLMILAVIVRAFAFSVFVLVFSSYPITQTATLLATTLVFIATLAIIRPFATIFYMIFKMLYEFVIFVVLVFLLVLACQDHTETFDVDVRSVFGVIFLSAWIAIPILTIIFGAIGLILFVKGATWKGSSEKKTAKVSPFEEKKPINKKKVIIEEPKTSSVVFIEPTQSHMEPSRVVVPGSRNNLEVPPVSILKTSPKKETFAQRTEQSESQVNLLPTRSPPSMNGFPQQQFPASLVLDDPPTKAPLYFDGRRNSASVIPRKQSSPQASSRDIGTDRAMIPKSESALVKNQSTGVMMNRSAGHMKNNSTSIVANKSNFSKGGEQMKPSSQVFDTKKRVAPFEVMELKLTPASLKVIDQEGFKSFIGTEGA